MRLSKACAYVLVSITMFGPATTAAPAPKAAPDHLIVNPSQVMGTCSYRAGTKPHTLTLFEVDQPSLPADDLDAFLMRMPPQERKWYIGNIAYLVIDSAPGPKPRVVWGAYGTSLGPVGPSGQKLMGGVVWDQYTKTAYAVLGQSNGGLSIHVFKINLGSDLAPLPLKLEATSRISGLLDVGPLAETACQTGFTDVKAVQVSATEGVLQLHFLRDHLDDGTASSREPAVTEPVDIFFDLTAHRWSSSRDRGFGRFRVDRL